VTDLSGRAPHSHNLLRPKGFLVEIDCACAVIDNSVKHCQGVDVLIHEVIDDQALRKLVPGEQLLKAIVGHHTTPEQAGQIFDRVKPIRCIKDRGIWELAG
jgi:hypothetical protein